MFPPSLLIGRSGRLFYATGQDIYRGCIFRLLNLFFVGDLDEKPPVFLIMRQLLPGDCVVGVNRSLTASKPEPGTGDAMCLMPVPVSGRGGTDELNENFRQPVTILFVLRLDWELGVNLQYGLTQKPDVYVHPYLTLP